MKYFLKQYWRYIAMALAFATFNFLINACDVHALERIQSIPLNYTNESQNMNINIYTSSGGNFANWGRGYLTFSIAQYKAGAGINFTMSTIKGIRVTSSGNIYTCQFGTTSNNFDYDDNLKLVVYSVICDITMGNQGLQSIDIEMSNSLTNSIVTKTSEYMTFSDNLDIDISQAINSQTTLMQSYLQTIINQQTNYTDSINQTITNVVNSNFATLIALLNGQLNTIVSNSTAVKDNTKDINDSINNSDTNGSQSQANDFFNNFDSGQTGTLMDLVSLPLDFLNSLNNACTPINITIPFFNQSFQLPCLRSSLTSAFGGIVSIIVLVINAILCYRLIKGFIDIIQSLKDPNNDEIEVMDL